MELFNLKNNQVERVDLKPFKLEKEIQSLVEKNTENIFHLEFIQSEYTLGKYRIDTLCFDKENNSFVIIEYKKGNSYSVIDQGYSYLQLLLNNKSDFLLTLSQHYNKVLRKENIDWSQSKIIFISPSYNSYQKDSVNFKNVPFELWEIKRFTNNSIIFNKHKSNSKESIESLSNMENQTIIDSVSREVRVVDEEEHTSKLDENFKEKWDELRMKLIEMDNVELIPKKHYISLMSDNKTVCYFTFRKSSISMEITRGNLNPDGTTSKNYFNLDDPKQISKESSWKWKSGTRGTIYKIKITNSTDIDYLMFLIKQKYKNLNQ